MAAADEVDDGPREETFEEYRASKTITPWRLAKERESRLPTWTEKGTEFMIRIVEHMPYEYRYNNIFYGPKTEWKENIDGKYIYKPKAFVPLTEGEVPSLEGHFNSKDELMYPKLINSLNNSKEYQKLELEDMSHEFKNMTVVRGEGGQIFYEFTSEDGQKGRMPLKFYTHSPIYIILILFFMHKREGTTLKSFKLNRGDIHMETIDLGESRATKYYEDLIEKGLY